ncbi:hypothetical protein [Cryptosporangium aurantiacum]|uniref:Uncharacterized protein n=1 Tax=Cryptosporangium aurantiacum TaxID=134849 RepID=A0A1M7J8H4_9ACTN|nr:hypothetical protein [Cryptosporangium aurantiacum]SHM49316.1 hypothetical protein SAMN05443668_101719 [Cryptosporangium aurantiacum]
MANNALSNYLADLMSFTSAPTVPRELAVTVSSLVLLGVVWTIVDDRQFMLILSVVFGLYLALRLGLAARKQGAR